jgi:hypothetical protein
MQKNQAAMLNRRPRTNLGLKQNESITICCYLFTKCVGDQALVLEYAEMDMKFRFFPGLAIFNKLSRMPPLFVRVLTVSI